MSAITDAWSALYACQTANVGTQVVTIGATANIPAIIQQVPLDVEIADGSLAYGGTFTIQGLASALSNVEPVEHTAVTFTPVGSSRAVSLSVISVESNNGIFYVTAGDPNAS